MTNTIRPNLSLRGAAQNVLAWMVAAIASGASIVVGFAALSTITSGVSANGVGEFLEALIPGSLFFGLYVAALTAIPTLILTWVRRAAGWYGLTSHLVMGALTGGGAIQLFGVPLAHGLEGLPMTAFFAAAGLVGGAVYWRLSARSN